MGDLQYDEDLSGNGFYQRLLGEHQNVLETASIEGWIVCVPRLGSFSDKCLADQEFALAHVLVPNDELPETHFFNLNFVELKLDERSLAFGGMRVRVLFEEIFYRDGMKYKVWCLERPLHDMKKYGIYAEDDLSLGRFQVIKCLKDAVEFIRTVAKKKDIFEKIDTKVQRFIRGNSDFGRWQFEQQKAGVKMLYVECLDLILQNRKLKDRCQRDMILRRNVKVAIETYVMDKLYDHVKDVIDVCKLDQAENFNKIIRNLGDAHCTEFDVAKCYGDWIPLAKKELLKIDQCRTVIDKVACLQKVMDVLAKGKDGHGGLTMDDLVPLFIFLIIKSGLAHWIMTVSFLNEFQFNNVFNERKLDVGEQNFLIATLEAAVVYVSCGNITRTQRLGVSLEPKGGDGSRDETDLFDFRNADEFLDCLMMLMQNEEEAKIMRLLQDANNNHLFLASQAIDVIDGLYLPTIDDQNRCGQSAIHLAAILGNPKLLTIILNLQPNVNAVDARNWTALHYAAANGHQNLLLLLLHAGININSTSNDLHTSLHLACLNGHSGCVKALLYFSEHMRIFVDVNAQTELGHTPLHYAAKWGFLDIVETLLEYSARIDVVNKLGATALKYSHNVRITKLLKDAFVVQQQKRKARQGYSSPSRGAKSQYTSDHDASSEYAESNDNRTIEEMKRVEKALAAIATQDTRLACYYLGLESTPPAPHINVTPNPYEFSSEQKICHPLCTCNKCVGKSSEFYNLLKKPFSSSRTVAPMNQKRPSARLNLNATNGEGYTALHVAAMHGNLDMLRILLDERVNPTIRLKSGATPLHLATRERRLRAVRMLLHRCPTGDIVDLKDSRGDTPLHYAVEQNNVQLVQMLLDAKADRKIRNLQGKQPIDIARNNLYFNVVNRLELS